MQTPVLIGLDIGGTLSKISFIVPDEIGDSIPHLQRLIFSIDGKSLKMHCHIFAEVSLCFDFIEKYFKSKYGQMQIAVTGGGGYKYRAELLALQPHMKEINEFESLVEGLKFLEDQKVPIKTSTFQGKPNLPLEIHESVDKIELYFPYLLVNIGSGVSILKVQKKQNADQYEFERIGGTSLGGGYFMGLAKVLTGNNSFQKIMNGIKNYEKTEEITKEKNAETDQIPGSSEMGLDVDCQNLDALAKNVHNLVFQNISQIVLLSSQNAKIQNIIFTGSFTRRNFILTQCFKNALETTFDQSSSYVRRTISLEKYDGYLGAIGALCVLMKK